MKPKSEGNTVEVLGFVKETHAHGGPNTEIHINPNLGIAWITFLAALIEGAMKAFLSGGKMPPNVNGVEPSGKIEGAYLVHLEPRGENHVVLAGRDLIPPYTPVYGERVPRFEGDSPKTTRWFWGVKPVATELYVVTWSREALANDTPAFILPEGREWGVVALVGHHRGIGTTVDANTLASNWKGFPGHTKPSISEDPQTAVSQLTKYLDELADAALDVDAVGGVRQPTEYTDLRFFQWRSSPEGHVHHMLRVAGDETFEHDKKWMRALSLVPEMMPTLGTIEDPVYHGDQTVAQHTRAVCKRTWNGEYPDLADDDHGSRSWTLEESFWFAVFLWVAFLHDVGKPLVSRVVSGRVNNYGHEDVGATVAWRIMIRLYSTCALQDSWRDGERVPSLTADMFMKKVRQYILLHMRPHMLVNAMEDGEFPLKGWRSFFNECRDDNGIISWTDVENILRFSTYDIEPSAPNFETYQESVDLAYQKARTIVQAEEDYQEMLRHRPFSGKEVFEAAAAFPTSANLKGPDRGRFLALALAVAQETGEGDVSACVAEAVRRWKAQ